MMKQTILSTLIAVSLSIAATQVYNNTCSAAPVAAAGAVDLTVAAEKALPCVVHIKFLQNSKVQEVEVQNDPFGDMFDPFGFFGRGYSHVPHAGYLLLPCSCNLHNRSLYHGKLLQAKHDYEDGKKHFHYHDLIEVDDKAEKPAKTKTRGAVRRQKRKPSN
jgi:hypothetical protein